ncbi:MAG: tetratricopeptide repeat protein, partial [Desulfobacterales bacterium]|nr:tetratricopeptide repeat protein [Desulfobacterales bacterium]
MNQNNPSNNIAALYQQALSYYHAGRVQESKVILSNLLESAPDHPDALYLSGTVAGAARDYNRAVAFFRRAIKNAPCMPHFHKDLGITYKEMGMADKALQSYQTALSIKPDYTDGHFSMGNLYKAAGRYELALECFQRAITLDPGYLGAYMNMNAIFEIQANFARMETNSREMIRVNPKSLSGYYYLGLSLMELGRLQDSLNAYAKALTINPNHSETLNGIGRVFFKTGRIDQSIIYYQKAILHAPNDYTSHMNLGHAQLASAAPRDAVNSYKKASVILPQKDEPYRCLGEVFQRIGDFESSVQAFREAIRLEPNNSWVYYRLSEIIKFKEKDDLFSTIEALLGCKDTRHKVSDLSNFHFALGKMYDDIKEYELAFNNYRRANDYGKPSTAKRFDLNQYIHTIDTMCEVFSGQFFAERQAWGSNDTTPVFILGMPRSGTTLLEKQLTEYEGFQGAGELDGIQVLSARVLSSKEKKSVVEKLLALTEDQVKKMADEYLIYLKTHSTASTFIIDKMPHNFQQIWLISLLFPKVKFLHCRRNPMDTCLSNYFTNFSAEKQPHTYDLIGLGKYYLQYERLMKHWKKIFPDKILDVKYENLL